MKGCGMIENDTRVVVGHVVLGRMRGDGRWHMGRWPDTK